MDAPAVESLLRDVQRRLWTAHFHAAARWALWGSAGVVLVVGALHLAGVRVHLDNVVGALAALWIASIAWAAWQRPSSTRCALWADRYLGGASAYSTLLEVKDRAQASRPSNAIVWLNEWANANVPAARRLLDQRRVSPKLFRPLVFALVAAALAALALTRPPLREERVDAGSHRTPGVDAPAAPAVTPLAPSGLASELESAVQSATRRESAKRGSTQPADGDRLTGDERVVSAMPADASATTIETKAAGSASVADASAASAKGGTDGTGTEGRQAGTGRDDSKSGGSSRALEALPVEIRVTDGRDAAKQADMERPARFDDEASPQRTPDAGRRLAAGPAMPPRATRSVALSPTEAHYVNAWSKTMTERR